eukprot:TRINITY_DN594_c0_g1_i4.p1 TRINITY_DN594_c0_g1~~TRINITY_DN594_c0_g1_i4.p1  ORF type:complete len:241 (+),score=42.92 TRINITY_DN594_c0_g1_i4:38-760(+)
MRYHTNSLMSLVVAIAVVSWVVCARGDTAACYMGDEDCPTCPITHPLSPTTTVDLSQDAAFRSIVSADQDVIASMGNATTIIRYDQLTQLHMSLNYFCCYSEQEKLKIYDTLSKYIWYPIQLNFTAYTCNADHDNYTVYLHSEPAQQAELFELVRGIEAALVSAGIPNNHPRTQNFHNTHARVTPEYPSSELVATLDKKYHGSALFYWFYADGRNFYAQNVTATMRRTAEAAAARLHPLL